jgi:hypothetical protein
MLSNIVDNIFESEQLITHNIPLAWPLSNCIACRPVKMTVYRASLLFVAPPGRHKNQKPFFLVKSWPQVYHHLVAEERQVIFAFTNSFTNSFAKKTRTARRQFSKKN